jgi:hypothetical protein
MFKKEALIEQEGISASTGENIGYELGAKFVKDYCDKYNEAGAHFVGRNIIEEILAQPGCIGIKIFKALNEKGEKTYVLTGVDQQGLEILEITTVSPDGSIINKEGIVADRNPQKEWFDSVFISNKL